MKNRHIALYYCIPHALLPLPVLYLLPILVKKFQLGPGESSVACLITIIALVLFILNRLPDLFSRSTDASANIGKLAGLKVFALLAPAFIATFYQQKGDGHTMATDFSNLSASHIGEYYSFKSPHHPNFSDSTVISENASWRRQELLVATPFGEVDGRKVILLNRIVNRFGRSVSGELPQEKLNLAREQSTTNQEVRFRLALRSDYLHVQRVPFDNWLSSPYPRSSIFLMWDIETPEEAKSGFQLLMPLFYLFPYCLLFAVLPFFIGTEDPLLVESLRKEPNHLKRLFFFRPRNP
ncbi:MAG: hypothetical protein ACK4E7_11915 [Permianibacter sp.]